MVGIRQPLNSTQVTPLPAGPAGGGSERAALGPSGPQPPLLGRRIRSTLSGIRTGRAYGNSQVTTDARGASQIGPGRPSQGDDDSGYSSFGGLRMDPRQRPSPWMNGTGGPASAFGGGWADGKLTVRDRHIMTRQGTVKHSSRVMDPALPNPQKDGPPLREYQMVNTTESWQQGTDKTTQENNHAIHNTVPVEGQGWRRFPLGTQDGTQTLVMGPPIGSYREYGARGPSGMHGPAPDIIDPNWVAAVGAGGGGGRGRLVQAGAPGMQPGDRRTLWGGYPHGLHSPTVQTGITTAARQASIPQMQPPRLDRPASSKMAGQSFSQTVVPEARAGRAVQQMPRIPVGDRGRMAGITNRFSPRT